MTRATKEDLVFEISAMLGVRSPKMSTGSTEPREIFDLVNQQLGLGLAPELTKPQMAKGIVEASGSLWTPSMESRGGTVTIKGIEAVRDAVRLFTE